MFMLSSHLWIRTHSALALDLCLSCGVLSFPLQATALTAGQTQSCRCFPACLKAVLPSFPPGPCHKVRAVATDPHRALLCGLTLETGFNRLLLALSEGRTAQAASLWLNTTKRERKQLELASRSRDRRGEDGWRPSHQSPGRPLREH